jgi:hypothetical protein
MRHKKDSICILVNRTVRHQTGVNIFFAGGTVRHNKESGCILEQVGQSFFLTDIVAQVVDLCYCYRVESNTVALVVDLCYYFSI